MICKTLDHLENELAETLQRISKIEDWSEFYKAQQIILNQKDEDLCDVVPDADKLLF
jgi:hypothetical protein